MATESLTLPPITPPPLDIGLTHKRVDLVVVCSLMHQRDGWCAVEHNERESCQVDLMDPMEDILPCALIHCRQFLLVQSIQGMIAVEVNIASSALGWDLVA